MMATSLFLAKVFGLYMIIMGAVFLFSYARFQRAINAYFADPALILITAIMTTVMGILLVVSHNIWVWDWRVIVTLLCWTVLIKGLGWLLFPDYLVTFSTKWNNKGVIAISMLLSMLVSLCLLYHGFFLRG